MQVEHEVTEKIQPCTNLGQPRKQSAEYVLETITHDQPWFKNKVKQNYSLYKNYETSKKIGRK